MADIDHNFTYHKPRAEDVIKYELVRQEAKAYANSLIRHCPESRELSLAMTHLEQAVMWANAAIARNPKGKTGDTTAYDGKY